MTKRPIYDITLDFPRGRFQTIVYELADELLELDLPDYDGTLIRFQGRELGDTARFRSVKPGRGDRFTAYADWSTIKYRDAHLGERYSVGVPRFDPLI